MDSQYLTSYFSDAIYLVILITCVLILPGLFLGLIVSIFQSATQINEQTLSFLPKLIITLLAILFTGQWIIAKIVELFHNIFINIPTLIS